MFYAEINSVKSLIAENKSVYLQRLVSFLTTLEELKKLTIK